jgi:hypothetical protein
MLGLQGRNAVITVDQAVAMCEKGDPHQDCHTQQDQDKRYFFAESDAQRMAPAQPDSYPEKSNGQQDE